MGKGGREKEEKGDREKEEGENGRVWRRRRKVCGEGEEEGVRVRGGVVGG